MAMAAIAAGADSLMIEVHPNPAKALSDSPQSLTPQRFDRLVQEMAVIGKAVDVGLNWLLSLPESFDEFLKSSLSESLLEAGRISISLEIIAISS